MMKTRAQIIKMIMMLVIILAACSTQQSPTEATITTISPTQPLAQSSTTPIPIFTILPTKTKKLTPSPTPIGTPLTNYLSVPIHPEAIGGHEEDSKYLFVTKISLYDLEEYYKENLVSLGWKLYGTTILEQNENDWTMIGLSATEISGKYSTVITISRVPEEKLSYVRISVFITD